MRPHPAPSPLDPYDAVLLVSFGGPEGPEEVVPFLENVTRGRGIPRERLTEVGEHYYQFGGRSPINEQCRCCWRRWTRSCRGAAWLCRCSGATATRSRSWTAEVRRIEAAGHRRVLAVVTSAYPSYSSCRQYRENLYDAATGPRCRSTGSGTTPNHPGFVAASVDATLAALDRAGGAGPAPGWCSSPLHPRDHGRDRRSGAAYRYRRVRRLAPRGRGRGGPRRWHPAEGRIRLRPGLLSRSGPPDQPWLEPDVNDHLAGAGREGARGWSWCRSDSSPTTWR